MRIVIKRAKLLIILSLLLIFLLGAINYPEFAQLRIPLLNMTINEIKEAVNPIISFLAAIVGGIFVQAMTIIYKLVYDSIQAHKEDINKMLKELLDIDKQTELMKTGSFMSATKITNSKTGKTVNLISEEGYILLKINSPICTKYISIRKKYRGLWEDLINHYPEIKESIEKICSTISLYNNEIIHLRDKLDDTLNSLTTKKINNKFRSKLSLGFEILIRSTIDTVISKLISTLEKYGKNNNKNDEEIKELLNKTVLQTIKEEISSLEKYKKPSSTGFTVGAYTLGNITETEWNEYIKPVLVEIITEFFKIHLEDLKKQLEKALELEDEIQLEEKYIRENLEYIIKSPVLRIKKICKYIQ